MSGKGSAPRPLSVSDEEFGKRFDAIDWSDRLVEGCDILRSEGEMGFIGKQCLYAANPLNGVEFNADDFGVIAVDSE